MGGSAAGFVFLYSKQTNKKLFSKSHERIQEAATPHPPWFLTSGSTSH